MGALIVLWYYGYCTIIIVLWYYGYFTIIIVLARPVQIAHIALNKQ